MPAVTSVYHAQASHQATNFHHINFHFMKLIKFLSAVTLAAAALTGCKTPQTIDSTYAGSTFAIECMGVDLDGSQTLRAWGTGKNKAQAMETAKKNAVRAVIFDGIKDGSQECNRKPLVFEVNAKEKYEQYFNRFFADGGDYKAYTSMTDEKRTSRLKSSNRAIENWGVVVRVDRAALRQRLIDDGIIKP